MASPPVCEFGLDASSFELSDAHGVSHSLSSLMGDKGLLIAFICNHCPYVKAIGNRLKEDSTALKAIGVNTVAIMSNDYQNYREDAPELMPKMAAQYGWDFPYLVDEDQSVAKAYGAVCTPDFFGYNADGKLQYRGRLDDVRMDDAPSRNRELVNAMTLIAETGAGPTDQTPSMGCSIKWRAA